MKLSLAEQCGDSARQCRRVLARLEALGVAGYDPRAGGYSKLFAFLRSLQTAEERSSAGYVTGKALSMARLGALSAFSQQKGDDESTQLLGVDMLSEERRYYEMGKRMLIVVATTEESQARGPPRRVPHARARGRNGRAAAAPQGARPNGDDRNRARDSGALI